jgi:dihydroxy-acid dehydratase
VKQTSVSKDMLKHSWKANVFYSEQAVIDWIKSWKIEEWDIIVLPFQWIAWAPWMPEMLTPTSAIKWAWFKKVALITDWRFSWWTSWPCIGHIYPEAYNWWKIWLIKNGDIINIDIPNRTLNVEVSNEEFEKRRIEKDYIIPERIMTPMLEKFRKNYTEKIT